MSISTFLSLLGLLFIGLKLAGVITWSWWLVLLPLWFGWAVLFAGAALIFLTGLAAVALAVLLETVSSWKGK